MSQCRTLHLMVYPGQANQRAHFGTWIAAEEGGELGTLIHVVGSPMTGFALQFRRRYSPEDNDRHPAIVRMGEIDAQYVHNFEGERGEDTPPRGKLEEIATQIQPPRPSENFRTPVNDTSNRRCQEWTMDFVRRLVGIRYLDESAIQIIQLRQDAPHVGIALRSVAQQALQPTTTQTGALYDR